MPIPSVEQFFALARSSPWRWSTLRFRVTWRGRMTLRLRGSSVSRSALGSLDRTLCESRLSMGAC
jgi:hypothetical protein